MAKFKIGDKLICIEDDTERQRWFLTHGSGYEPSRIITVRKITYDSPVNIYWPEEQHPNSNGIYETALDYYIEPTIDKEVLNDLLNSFDECLKID